MEFRDFKVSLPKESDLNLYFFNDIDGNSVGDFYKEFNSLCHTYKDIIEKNSEVLYKMGLDMYKLNNIKPVNIHFSTFGGSVYDGLALCSILHNNSFIYPFDVNIIASGMIMSMGVPIICSVPVKHRKAYRDTVFMIHQISAISLGTVKDICERDEELQRLNKQIFDIILKNTKITKEQLDDVYNKKEDWFITAEEAVELGLISEII